MTSHQSEWPSSKNLQIINAGEGVEKRKPSYTAGGNLNWCSHYGKQYGHYFKNRVTGASLVAQWLGIHLPRQGTWVQALIWEDPTCCGATKPVHHNHWACAIQPASHNYWACAPQLLKSMCLELVLCTQQEKPLQWEARAPQWRVAPAHRSWREPVCSNEDPMQPKINKLNKLI